MFSEEHVLLVTSSYIIVIVADSPAESARHNSQPQSVEKQVRSTRIQQTWHEIMMGRSRMEKPIQDTYITVAVTHRNDWKMILVVNPKVEETFTPVYEVKN